ncbi:MAG: glycosyltransferase family A protein [Chlamydiales bacterium]|nr:glycosyltransferase family A protein [Chlamydiales bacterium]
MAYASVAVVTRTKNRPLLLKRAIASVLAQTYTDWIMVIANDGGDPKVVEDVCHSFGSQFEGKYVLVHNATSMGVEQAGNLGALGCDSEYIAQLDDDDTYQPEFLETCVDYMRNSKLPELGGVITHWHEIWEKIEGDRVIKVSQSTNTRLQFISFYEMSFRCTIIPASFFYLRSAWEKAGRYNTSLHFGDWDFALRFLSHYEIGVIPKPLANYHRRTTTACNNSVQAFPNLLQHATDRTRNNFLREDLKQGRCGLGMLMALSHQLSQTSFWQLLKRDLSLFKRRWLYSSEGAQ